MENGEKWKQKSPFQKINLDSKSWIALYFVLVEGEKQSFSKSLGVVLSNWRAANTPRTIPQRMEPAENTADMIKMVFSLMAPPLWEMKRQLIFPKEAQKKNTDLFDIINIYYVPDHQFG